MNKHKCAESIMTCSGCGKEMCQQCVVVTPSALRCSQCAPTTWRTGKMSLAGMMPFAGIMTVGGQAMMRLQVASVMYSLILAKLLSIITPCIG